MLAGDDTSNVLKCKFEATACPGGNSSRCASGEREDYYCACGYIGPLCSVCDKGYFKSWAGPPKCDVCDDTASYMPTILLAVLLFVPLAAGVVVLIFKLLVLIKKGQRLYEIGAMKMRIIFFGAQVISQYSIISGGTGEEKQYPEPSSTVVALLGIANLEIIKFVPLECIYRDADFYVKLQVKTQDSQVGNFKIFKTHLLYMCAVQNFEISEHNIFFEE